VLARDRLDEAREILLQWGGTVADGMLPNRFPDAGESPEYNSVDASLWYIIAVHDFLTALPNLADNQLARLRGAIRSILEGYTRGTRYGIAADPADGLLMCGQPGVQLTWMDAKVGDWVVTPRIGKPVEVQALWLNALRIASAFDSRWEAPFEQGLASFIGRFHDPERGCLYEVVDNDRQPGAIDRALRPNQILAVGGLPFALLAGPAARAVVDTVEARLLTPAGLRTLAPGEPGYIGHYGGNQHDRDAAYQQGTVWPWLIGPFVEAWLRVRQWSPEAKAQARERFLLPLYRTLDPLATGQLPEIADGDAPHTARGCPFQAWSVGEALRLRALLK
jgi:predicted glycogen debranching enzyme